MNSRILWLLFLDRLHHSLASILSTAWWWVLMTSIIVSLCLRCLWFFSVFPVSDSLNRHPVQLLHPTPPRPPLNVTWPCTCVYPTHRTEAWAAAQPDGDGVPERVPNHVAVATGARASDPILHDQVSDRCGVEDAEPGPDSARGLVVSCKESGRRTDVLLPCAGQFAEELRVEWRSQVSGAGPC